MSSRGVIDGNDRRFLDAAIRLARKNQGQTGTNPSVACIIVRDFGCGPVIVGSAVTGKGGRPHAEPPALMEAGDEAMGATAYVTLEPCAHHGKTPPCAEALITAGVARVVTAIADPDDRVNGKGHQMLMDGGVAVDPVDGGEQAARVLQGYLKARSGVFPFVTLKVAMDKNGLIGCDHTGNLKISCRESMLQTHLVRARSHAIIVGASTVLSDDPSLTCRLPGMAQRSPIRVVLDNRFRIHSGLGLVRTAREIPTWIVAPAEPPEEWASMVLEFGLQHIPADLDDDGRIALPEMLEDLAAKGIQSVMVEGGARLTDSFLKDDLIDEIIVHEGGEPETLPDEECAVHAPFTTENLPLGFEIVQKLVFGSDISYRLRKRGQ
ncbi:MAG: bifunctional diaminohydroxyphosphoribosylaminopyrimidine deaminase/5-amino-6-(5-phosphoribosylamino)uracil reductase RibD [Pseudomonadota bacterium]